MNVSSNCSVSPVCDVVALLSEIEQCPRPREVWGGGV